MRIVSLIDNTAVDEKLFSEEGMSLFVEHNGKNILIDAGRTGKAVENARRMRLPIDRLDSIVLTHNSLSHVGGIDAVMRLNPSVRIYLRAGARNEVFRKKGLIKQPVGAPRSFFKRYEENLCLFNSFSEVFENFYLASCEDFDERMQNPDRSFRIQSGKKAVPFDHSDESFAVIFPREEKEQGLVIIGGCFHCGAVNMLETVKRRWYGVPILAVIGGFHFSGGNPKTLNCPAEVITAQAKELKYSGAEKIYACHCTGFKGFDVMDEVLGDRILYLGGGEALEF